MKFNDFLSFPAHVAGRVMIHREICFLGDLAKFFFRPDKIFVRFECERKKIMWIEFLLDYRRQNFRNRNRYQG